MTHQAPQNGRNVYPLLTPEDLLNAEPPSYLVGDTLPELGVAVIYGGPASFKSFVAISLAGAVAAGIPWFGHDVKPGYVVYIAAEGRAGLGARYRAWHTTAGQPTDVRLRILPESVNLLDPTCIERAQRTIAALPEPPRLLVIDTAARSIPGGDENSARDMGLAVAHAEHLARGGLALFIHHTQRGGDQERGSGALRGAADAMLKLKRDGRDATLSVDKMKDGEEPADRTFRLEQVGDSAALTLASARPAPGSTRGQRIITLIAEQPGLSGSEIARRTGIRKQDVLDTLKRLHADDRIEEQPGGGWAVPTTVPDDFRPAATTPVPTPVPQRFPAPGNRPEPAEPGTPTAAVPALPPLEGGSGNRPEPTPDNNTTQKSPTPDASPSPHLSLVEPGTLAAGGTPA